MTQTQAQPLFLDPATFIAMLGTTVDTLPHHPRASAEQIASRQEAAFLFIAALRPRDPLEAVLAARIVGVHYHTMYNLGCATQPDLPPNLQLRFQGRAIGLCRLMDATLNNYLDRQTAPARQPLGLPAAVGPTFRVQPAPEAAQSDVPADLPAAPEAAPTELSPAPEAAHADPPPAPAQADATAQQAAPAPRPAAPTQRPAAPAPAPQHAKTPAPRQPTRGPDSLEAATEARLLAELSARTAVSAAALTA